MSTPLEGLRHLSETLRQLGVEFCLVGGLAVSVRAEVRFTRDVDLCVIVDDDAAAEALIFQLQTRGYRVVATVEHQKHARLATARLRGPSGVVCDLLMASSGIEREVAQRAGVIEVEQGCAVAVARVEELVALKVLAATPARPLDTADLQQLLDFNPETDLDAVRQNLTLIEQRGYQRDQDLHAKFAEILRALRGG